MKLTIYDLDKKTVKREVEGSTYDLWFGTVRNLMKLLKIDKAEDTSDLLGIVAGAWDEVIIILSDVFPDVTVEEWDYVKANEVISVILEILTHAVSSITKQENIQKN